MIAKYCVQCSSRIRNFFGTYYGRFEELSVLEAVFLNQGAMRYETYTILKDLLTCW